MKIRQIGEFDGDIISTILKNRNIEDVDLFLNPTADDDLNSFNLSNMRLGVEITLAHLLISNKIGILVDPDADGFSSSSIIYQYLKKIEPQCRIDYFLHDGKTHGLTDNILEKISETDIDLIIIPDAASNDEEGIKKLYHMGIDVVIIDHHEVENEPSFGVLINNQLDHNEETNKNLVGAGMSLKFCEALDKVLSKDYAKDFYDLVAIGQVGDASDISQNEVRSLVFRGLESVKNPFIDLVLTDHFGHVDNVAPRDLSFSIIPLINSVVRVGTMEEKDLLFRALNSIGSEQTWTVQKRKKNKTTGKFDKFEVVQNIYEYAYDSCKKVKARQNALVKKVMAALGKEIKSDGGIVVGVLPTSDMGSITGLVANKLASKYQKPALLVHKIEVDGKEKYVGSGRGNEKVLMSLKDWCNNTGLVEYAQGHANAFGISIFVENYEDFLKKTENVESEEFVYSVDYISQGKVNKQILSDIIDNKKMFGGKVHDPLIAFTGIKVPKRFIRQRGSMMTFFCDGLEFVLFSAPERLYESLTNNFDEFITMDFVGRAGSNNYGGKTTIQMILEDCERNESPTEIEFREEVTAETIVF